jgi:hypothetical protein
MMVRIARGNEVVDSALQVIANAVTVEQLRQAQAVVLPLRYGLSLAQTAQVTDLSMGWVSKQRNRFIQGKAVGDGTVSARGGRRRQNFTLDEKVAVLKPFLKQAREGVVLVVGQIKSQLEEALGRPMSLSSVYALLHRHHWRKLVPDRCHPHSDPVTQERGKTPRNTPRHLQRLDRSTHAVDVSRRSPLGAHQRCAPLLGTTADAPVMQSNAHTRIHLILGIVMVLDGALWHCSKALVMPPICAC